MPKPTATMTAPKITVKRMPSRSAIRPIKTPPTPDVACSMEFAPSAAGAAASDGQIV
jgi:hypothetical protein